MKVKFNIISNKNVVETAKKIAKKEGQSLSAMIENYLLQLVDNEEPFIETTALVESLSGSIKIDKDFNYKEELSDILTEKYIERTH